MPIASLDFETTGFSPQKGARVFAYVIMYESGEHYIGKLTNRKDERYLERFLLDTSFEKVCHNLKFELSFIHYHGWAIAQGTVWHDTMIMAQLLDNTAYSHALDVLAADLCDYPTDVDDEVAAIAKAYGGYDKVPDPLMREYQRRDGERTMILYNTYRERITGRLLECYQNEIETIKVTQRMETRGIRLSRPECHKLISWMRIELEKNETNLYEMAGSYYNLSSPDDVSELLYKKFGLPVLKKTKKSGKPAVDKPTLAILYEKFSHPILDVIRRHRSYTKGIADVNNYLSLATDNDIIYPNIRTNHADTGRQAASNPNLQNVAKAESQTNKFPVPARKCFIPREGHVLLFADYSGIEMRLIIDTTGEEELLELVKRNGDPHKLAAEIFYGSRFAGEDTKRSAAKNAQFAKAYGAGLVKVAATLALSIEEAAPGYHAYCKRFPKVAGFTGQMISLIREDGFVTTAFGRQLRINPEKAYSGSNYVIQGTAAEILKRAEVAVDKYLRDEWNDEIYLLLPIHDELVFETQKKLLPEIPRAAKRIRELMIDMPQIRIPLDVEWKITETTWNAVKKWKPVYHKPLRRLEVVK